MIITWHIACHSGINIETYLTLLPERLRQTPPPILITPRRSITAPPGAVPPPGMFSRPSKNSRYLYAALASYCGILWPDRSAPRYVQARSVCAVAKASAPATAGHGCAAAVVRHVQRPVGLVWKPVRPCQVVLWIASTVPTFATEGCAVADDYVVCALDYAGQYGEGAGWGEEVSRHPAKTGDGAF